MWLNWPLDLTGRLSYRHLLPVPSVQEGPSDGQHGVTGLWPERGEDFVNDRVLNAKRPSFMLCLFSFVYFTSDNQKSAVENEQKRCRSYHKGEALHCGYLVATGDLHCVIWWGEVPAEHRGTLDLSPPKHNPPPNIHTYQALYHEPPSVYLNSMIIYCPAVTHKEAIFIWELEGSVFLVFFSQFVMMLFVARGSSEWDMVPSGFGASGKSGSSDFSQQFFS